MGWVESPPALCAGTETVADLANAQCDRPLPKHPLEDAALTRPLALPPSPPSPTTDVAAKEEPLAPPPLGHRSRPTPQRSRLQHHDSRPTQKRRRLRHHDICVDDHISLVQGSAKQCHQHLQRLLHSIDKVFRPLDNLDAPHREHVPSIKKMKARDANCDTRKVILG